MTEQERFDWICTTIDIEGGERLAPSPTDEVSMGVAAKSKLWKKGTTLKVAFLGGSEKLQTRVLKTASLWLVPGVQLKIEKAGRSEKAQIRIAFDAQEGSWSYVGTDNLTIRPSQPTMNLGWATEDTPEHDFSSVVLHEWGHALGLLHEHNHPEAKIEWNKDAVYKELSDEPNNWDRATIDSNVFERFEASSVITTDFDQVSIMIYTIPKRWTKNGKRFMPSWRLSEGDKATILKLYK